MTREEVLAIKALADRATPGPWTLDKRGRYEDHDECTIELADDDISLCRYENGEFVAASRTAVPVLCDEVLRLMGEVSTTARERDYHKSNYERVQGEFAEAHPVLAKLIAENARLQAKLEAAKRDIRHVLRADFTYDVCGICDQHQARGDCWDCENANWRGLCAENGGRDA